MKRKPFVFACILSVLVLNLSIFAQEILERKIAILPFSAVGLDEATLLSARTILRLEIAAASDWVVVPDIKVQQAADSEPCAELDCAVEIGRKLNASRVITCNLTALGEKILVHYMLVDVTAEAVILRDNATAFIVEDLDAVLKRVAASVSKTKPIQRTAEVDNITMQESLDPLRRGSNTISGFTFGYLFPQDGYDGDDRSFTMDFRVAQEIDPFEVGLLLAARKGFAVNIFGNYLFTRNDICPFLGGAFGFHWIHHDKDLRYDFQTGLTQEDNRRGDGFEITLNGGLKLFRTYNFQILLNFAYSVTFNDYDDKATVFTFGLVK